MKRARLISLCSMLTALGAALLWLGAVTDILDITLCFAASLIIVFAEIELGTKASFLIYLATGILSLIILPAKSAALIYLFFAGNYPMIKRKAEAKIKSTLLITILKAIYFSVAMAVIIAVSKYIFGVHDSLAIEAATFILGVLACLMFDYVLTRLITVYFYKLRKRLGVDKLLK